MSKCRYSPSNKCRKKTFVHIEGRNTKVGSYFAIQNYSFNLHSSLITKYTYSNTTGDTFLGI